MSEPTHSEPIVYAENLNLVFNVDYHRAWTVRDLFTSFVSDPLGLLLRKNDRLHLIKDMNLKVMNGERIGVVGMNGMGKTSLCRMIAGMYAPTSGVLRVNGRVRAIFDTGVGIRPELTGRENAELLSYFMFPEIKSVFRKMIIDEALEFSELGKFLDAPYRIYSNGMQARLCLSIVSCLPSDVLILDEVFDGADASFKDKVSRRIMKMIEASGTVFFVSHSLDQIKLVCNRVLVIHQGALAHDGDVEKGIAVYEQILKR